MRKTLALMSFGLLAATALPLHAAGTVEITYVEPEKFSDIGFGSVDRDITLRQMTAVLQEFAAKLPDGQTLKLEVTNINLAGEMRPGHGREVRVLRGMADWPEINLRYTLQAGGSTLKSGDAKIYDLAYQQGASSINNVGTNLPYERRMLREWFAKTFADH